MVKVPIYYLCLLFVLQQRNITQAKTLVNKALNKHTIQSETLTWPYPNDIWSSEHAVDGRKICPTGHSWQDYSGTENQDVPWWQVDLGKVFTIDRVIVYGRPGFTSFSETARFATVNVSSVLEYGSFDYNQDHVKDNKTTTSDIDTCGCCWASKYEQNPYIQLTLPTSQSLDSIIILGRSDGHNNDDSTSGIEVWTNGRFVDHNLIHRDASAHTSTIRLQSIDAKTITIFRPKTDTLNPWTFIVCEIYIYIDVFECPIGRFGYLCENKCGHCLGGSCDIETGQCAHGCHLGYMNEFCNEVCSPYHYGNNCSLECGRCRDNSYCNHVNGSCLSGCAPGYKPGNTLCNDECETGYFGEDCLNTCSRHCANGLSRCDKVTGACMDGCEPGYLGFGCTTSENLLIQINDKIHLEMSSTYNETWAANLAIDGNTGPDPDRCHCCSRTKNSEMSWWRVDLNGLYPLKYVNIHAREEGSGIIDQLGGFSLYLTNDTGTRNITFYTDVADVPKKLYRIPLNNTLARYFTIKRPGVLTICEVVLIEGECADGYYGDNCSSQCNCFVNKQCNRLTGECTVPYCKLGWMGSACNIKCRLGTFGEGCGGQCFCAIGDVCSHDYGICPGNCMEGYQESDKPTTENRTENAAVSSKMSIIIGASVGSSVVVLLSAAAIVVILYKRLKEKDKNKYIYTQPDLNLHSNDNSDYDTLEGNNVGYVNGISSM